MQDVDLLGGGDCDYGEYQVAYQQAQVPIGVVAMSGQTKAPVTVVATRALS